MQHYLEIIFDIFFTLMEVRRSGEHTAQENTKTHWQRCFKPALGQIWTSC